MIPIHFSVTFVLENVFCIAWRDLYIVWEDLQEAPRRVMQEIMHKCSSCLLVLKKMYTCAKFGGITPIDPHLPFILF